MTHNGTTEGTIFDIKRFAVYDGPGIRTTVFLKGCFLHCLWCHNPESISGKPQLVFTPQKCIGCGQCFEVCPQSAHQLIDGEHVIAWDRCLACGTCAEGCYAGALELAGRRVTAGEVIDEVLRDRAFYETSGGGMTLSGGEPLVQYDFARALLQGAKAGGVHTALDTTGLTTWDRLSGLLSHVDLILYDLKQMDEDQHLALTGVSNVQVLENLQRLDDAGQPSWIRLPLIPGQNDEDVNYHALGQFLSGLNHVDRIEILRYHRLAESKYESVGYPYELKGLESPSEERAESRREILLSYGLSQTVAR